MACLGMHHGVTRDCVIRKHHEQSPRVSEFTHLSHLTIPNLAGKHRLSTAVNAFAFNCSLQTNKSIDKFNDRTSSIESPRVSENLDEWMRKSVTEIVKNITQAPLLVQIYADGQVKTKKAVPENDWKHRSPSLEGVILVEEITTGEEAPDDDGGRAFGVLIQGKVKGDECRSTCYLLKTSSVNGGGGLGFGCTHFCLMKVKSFHQNVFSQFRDCWLVQ
ncbi:hypothetical protein HanRHA438_Chr09g0395081 [Helianthus annuus]|uniref:DUF7804 domain-containing protein n=1 Tax=Helianthus annuus TaxID=4232 RepID=A0A251TU56_HELAN|nr:hypothetical protein HanXRQr2_Chr09g0383431 [Helianthus annuus]KAJ0525669.1 hypothetical protein HanHA300_Chr09g0314721 [Helianthus annuus]KAJ0533889.1 hypothetical protein HanIR_Chr09g0413601 [Helianthus annuus]KAJ0542053.1 hypothetical protein HanHA89_Chr09g0335601 [Helianthus annuus]KAJ0707117.1 hypothetical protein HanLR1_Chr09g0314941 [Helianthus annuus]